LNDYREKTVLYFLYMINAKNELTTGSKLYTKSGFIILTI